jgi:hypothetical protein
VEILGAVMLRFDERELGGRLSRLPKVSTACFAASCAARLENTSRTLSVDRNLQKLLAETLNAIVAYVGSGTPFDMLSAEEDLLASMPDEDTNPDFHSAVAEDAAAATVYTLRVIREGLSQDAVWAAMRAYAAADREVMGTLNTGEVGVSEQAYILQHSIVQTELQRQLRDLNAVLDAGAHDSGALVPVVMRARSETILRV